MQTFRIRKLVNAFIPNAVPSELLELLPGAVLWAVNRFSTKHGGLWVGGSVEISHDGVLFKPNALNEAFHEGLESVHIPMTQVLSVAREFGWITGIVVVAHQLGEFRFRCFGAKKIAQRVSALLNEP